MIFGQKKYLGYDRFSPAPLWSEYHRRSFVSLLCSGWEEVVPNCSNNQGETIIADVL